MIQSARNTSYDDLYPLPALMRPLRIALFYQEPKACCFVYCAVISYHGYDGITLNYSIKDVNDIHKYMYMYIQHM